MPLLFLSYIDQKRSFSQLEVQDILLAENSITFTKRRPKAVVIDVLITNNV